MTPKSKIPYLALGFGLVASSCSNSNFSGANKSAVKSEATAQGNDDEVDGQEGGGGSKGRTADQDDSDGEGGSDGDGDLDASDHAVQCKVNNVADGGEPKQGYGGKVYRLPENTNRLPDLTKMTPIGQVNAASLDVKPRDWKDGFPGLPDLFEWFAIAFDAVIVIPEDGTYVFKTISDDGSRLYVDSKLVVENDGTHGPEEKLSSPMHLGKGKHRIRVEWFQGPRYQIALQVQWKKKDGDFTPIPENVLKHVKDCELQDLGTFN